LTLILKSFARSEAELAAELPAHDLDFGKCRSCSRWQGLPTFPPIPRHVPFARHKKPEGERRKSWIFNRLESAAEMHCARQ